MSNLTNPLSSTLSPPRSADAWIEKAGRAGYITRGVIYGLIGLLTASAARIGRSNSTDSQGAIREISSQPFGKGLLILVTVGLLGYAVFQLMLAVRNTRSETKERFKRIGHAISAGIHASLAIFSGKLAIGSAASSGPSETARSANVLALPGGQVLLAVIGIIFMGLALQHFKRSWKKDFMKHFRSNRFPAGKLHWIEHIGRFGIAARGVTFGIIGGFLVKAALDSRPEEVRGLKGAFTELARQPSGTVLLLVVALGFVAFGVYSILRGIYGRLQTE